MRVEGFSQASTYTLVFPFTLDKQPVSNVNDVKFSLRKGNEDIVEYELGDTQITFADSTVEVAIESTLSIELNTIYTFELWFKDTLDRPYLIRKGTLIFESTNTRF